MVHVENAGGLLYDEAQLKELAMKSAPTLRELVRRISALEERVALLETEWERTQIQAAIRRGLDEMDRGMAMPAKEWAKKTRAKHNLRQR